MANPFGPVEVVGGIALGTGVGAAVGDVVVPKLQDFLNTQWSNHQNKPLAASAAAAIVAENVEQVGWGTVEASLTGISGDRFQALYNEALNAPGLPELLTLLRRQIIGAGDFTHGLRKAKLEPLWDPFVTALRDELLSPQELAVMIQRTVVANPGILPNQPSTAGSNVPPMPQVGIDPVLEASHSGYTEERLAALARIIGLPASNDLAARMFFRGIVTEGAYNQAILEGNTRGEWAPFLLEGFREILTANQYAELELRGFADRAQRLANTAKHGMSTEDSDALFNVLGRAPGVHAITTGLARGGEFNGPIDTIPRVYLSAIQRSNTRPEYYNIAYANRYTYPGAFVLRALTEAGDISETEAHDILLFEGWEPTLAATVAAKWASKAGGAGAADPHVKKAQNTLWTEAHKAYVKGGVSELTVSPALNALGIPGDAQVEIFNLWNIEKQLIAA